MFAVTLVVFAFTIQQIYQDQVNLNTAIEQKSALQANNFNYAIVPYVISSNFTYIQQIINKTVVVDKLIGISIYDNNGNLLAHSSRTNNDLERLSSQALNEMNTGIQQGQFLIYKSRKLYFYTASLRDQKNVLGSIVIIQNAEYINSQLVSVWEINLIRLLAQALLIALAIFISSRWIIYQPILAIVQAMRDVRRGREIDSAFSKHFFFQPLIDEISSMSKKLRETQMRVSQEARMRQEQAESPWTGERLIGFAKEALMGRKLILISNREPYIHMKQNGNTQWMQPASGIVTALEPMVSACGGLWIAHGSGDADRQTVDQYDHIAVPPEEPKYSLRRVWLTKQEENGYYYGFSNEGLWPLCHTVHTRPIFRKDDWLEYQRVNSKFAQTTIQEIKNISRPIILIQDYHFAILPRLIKNARPDALVGIFWHIPWPGAELFQICPWRKEILDGMLGADLIGFHTQLHCNNFIDTVGHDLEALIDLEQFAIQRKEHLSFVKPFPVSIPLGDNQTRGNVNINDSKKLKTNMLEKLGISSSIVGLGVDRLDYTKGILERIQAIEYFLKAYPAFKEQFVFIQIAAPTRSNIRNYSKFAEEVEKEIERINNLFKIRSWKPIIFLKRHHTHEEIDRYYKIADFCLVTSLHDGMNLVAKEYIMSRIDQKGVLILSQFAGASKELKDSLIVNPYNIEQTGEAIHLAITMMPSEQMKRMQKMQEIIRQYNVYKWSADLLKTLVSIA